MPDRYRGRSQPPTHTEDKVNPTRTDTYRGRSQPNMYPHAPRTKSTQHVPRTKPCPTGTKDKANPQNIPTTKSKRQLTTHPTDKTNPTCNHRHPVRSLLTNNRCAS